MRLQGQHHAALLGKEGQVLPQATDAVSGRNHVSVAKDADALLVTAGKGQGVAAVSLHTGVKPQGAEKILCGGTGTLARSTVGSAAFCRATDGGDTHQVHEIGHELFAVLLQPAADLAVIYFVDHKKPPVSGGIGWMIAQNGKFCYRFLKKINNTRCRRQG